MMLILPLCGPLDFWTLNHWTLLSELVVPPSVLLLRPNTWELFLIPLFPLWLWPWSWLWRWRPWISGCLCWPRYYADMRHLNSFSSEADCCQSLCYLPRPAHGRPIAVFWIGETVCICISFSMKTEERSPAERIQRFKKWVWCDHWTRKEWLNC